MGQRKGKSRREPKFDAAPAVRVSADDRPAPAARPPRTPKTTRGKGGGGWRFPGIKRLAYWTVVAGIWLVIMAGGTLLWVGAHLPPIQSLEIPKRPPSVLIVSSDGKPLATRGEMGGASVSLRELPAHLPKAFIAIEDRRFYSHSGIDPFGVSRALLANVMNRGVAQGGSTITQQLAKNLFLTQERTYGRKLQEVVLALWLEHKYTKEQILELYINRVYFGAGAYGVEAAAQRYFGKSARQVTIAEAAMLAGLVKSPSRLAPHINREGAERRAQLVLAAMVETDAITEPLMKAALAKPAQAVKHVNGGSAGYVADWIMDVINDIVGRVEQDIVVETSIDSTLQANAERFLAEELAAKGEKANVGQGAMVSMRPDGAVVALVGGRNYAESQFNRAVAAKRQPGSSFKPFVYLTALERGLMPETVRDDKPISIKGWKPENFTHEYQGPVTLAQALSMSLNTVSVRLTMEFGPVAVARTAYRLGIASKLDPNPSIALGTSEVSLIELVSAYAPMANGGNAAPPHVVQRVKSTDGKTLYIREPDRLGRIIEPRFVAMMNSMLRETLLSGTARRADLGSWQAGGKTGTSQEYRDAWFVGYTSQFVTGVWLGNDDATPTKKASGSGIPVDIWSRFMKSAHQGTPVAGLPGLSGPSLASIFAPAPPSPIAPPTPPAAIPGAPIVLAPPPPAYPIPLPPPPRPAAQYRPPEPAPRPAPVPPTGNIRPQAENGLDGWFRDRMIGR